MCSFQYNSINLKFELILLIFKKNESNRTYQFLNSRSVGVTFKYIDNVKDRCSLNQQTGFRL